MTSKPAVCGVAAKLNHDVACYLSANPRDVLASIYPRNVDRAIRAETCAIYTPAGPGPSTWLEVRRRRSWDYAWRRCEWLYSGTFSRKCVLEPLVQLVALQRVFLRIFHLS